MCLQSVRDLQRCDTNKNIAYYGVQVSHSKGTNGLNIALLKVGDVEHFLLGRVSRLNDPA